ncbi:MAG: hypothetical protein ACI9JM_003162 [Halioglobus sp.]|jgi:uncharacterized protein (DUF1330 family)
MTQPVYFIAQIDVKDYKSYIEEYGMPLLELLNKIGAQVLSAAPEFGVLEGHWPGNWVATIRFPSAEVATTFYNSEEYAPLKSKRIDELSNAGTVIMVPGLEM